MVVFGKNTGFRASELCSIVLDQVLERESDTVRSHVRVERRHLKGGAGIRRRAVTSRRVAINSEAAAVVREYLAARFPDGQIRREEPLFLSRKGGRGLSQWAVSRVVKSVLALAGDSRAYRYGSHTLRKTFANKIQEVTRDIFLTRAALGHAHVTTTEAYLQGNDEEVDSVVLSLPKTPATAPADKCDSTGYLSTP